MFVTGVDVNPIFLMEMAKFKVHGKYIFLEIVYWDYIQLAEFILFSVSNVGWYCLIMLKYLY